jgi:target of rapamycin complex 2 subunit MAPKAP1
VNNSILNAPGFRAAGWSAVPSNSSAQIKRTYSPPIPTTALPSEYYRLTRRAHGELSEADGLGIVDDGEEDEGGMVTGGGGSTYTLGTRHHGKVVRRNRRRERQQKPGDVEEEDSSDLSDESDDEGEFTQRSVAGKKPADGGTQLFRTYITQGSPADKVL